MSHSNLTRWIEDADARRCSDAAAFDRSGGVTESHYLDLGAKIAKLPSWLWRGVHREPPAAIACPKVAHIRHRQLRRDR
jgi:hypothetical protein